MLTTWAIRWGIPPQAVDELRYLMGCGAPHPTGKLSAEASETAVQTARRLAAAQAGGRLFRNNQGAFKDDRGVMVRFGLGNDSTQTNRVFKSSDLIGIMPVVCDCGRRWGVFWAEECKRPGWHYTGTEREVAQKAFLDMVVAMGGIGRFVSNGEGV